MKPLAAVAASVLLALAGLGLAGCNDGPDKSITNSPGVNTTPVQPTTGTAGTKAPTPPAKTTNTATTSG